MFWWQTSDSISTSRLYNLTTVCYHALYLPFLYVTFLADFFQVCFIHCFIFRLPWKRLFLLIFVPSPWTDIVYVYNFFFKWCIYRRRIFGWRMYITLRWKMLVFLMLIGTTNAILWLYGRSNVNVHTMVFFFFPFFFPFLVCVCYTGSCFSAILWYQWPY